MSFVQLQWCTITPCRRRRRWDEIHVRSARRNTPSRGTRPLDESDASATVGGVSTDCNSWIYEVHEVGQTSATFCSDLTSEVFAPNGHLLQLAITYDSLNCGSAKPEQMACYKDNLLQSGDLPNCRHPLAETRPLHVGSWAKSHRRYHVDNTIEW
jgi:hypothetical protein